MLVSSELKLQGRGRTEGQTDRLDRLVEHLELTGYSRLLVLSYSLGGIWQKVPQCLPGSWILQTCH